MNLVQVDFEFDEFFEKLGRKSNVSDGLLLSCKIIEVNGILLNILSLLINDIRVKLRIRVFIRETIPLNFGHKHVSTLTWNRHPVEFRISLIIRDVTATGILRCILQMWLVVLKTEGE
jgi:hypothetical protein